MSCSQVNPMPPEGLDRLVGDGGGAVGGARLRHRGGQRQRLGLRVGAPRGVISERARLLDVPEHLREPMRNRLVGADRAARTARAPWRTRSPCSSARWATPTSSAASAIWPMSTRTVDLARAAARRRRPRPGSRRAWCRSGRAARASRPRARPASRPRRRRAPGRRRRRPRPRSAPRPSRARPRRAARRRRSRAASAASVRPSPPPRSSRRRTRWRDQRRGRAGVAELLLQDHQLDHARGPGRRTPPRSRSPASRARTSPSTGPRRRGSRTRPARAPSPA